jgi:hypothetical protein
MNRKIRIQRLAPQDREEWQKLYYRHQSHRLRRRLLALRAVWDGQTLVGVCRTQKVGIKTLERWLDLYLHGGFPALLAPVKHKTHAQTLSASRRKVLHHILLHKLPADYGLDGYQWTAGWAQALIEKKWGCAWGGGAFTSFSTSSASRTSARTGITARPTRPNAPPSWRT